VSQEIAGY